MGSTMSTKGARTSQRGVSRSTELAVLMPVLLGVLFVVIVIAITTHGKAVVQEAANLGAEHAAFFDSSPQVGVAKAREFAERSGLRNVDVSLRQEGSLIAVEVKAWVPNPLGERFGQVTAQASRVREAG